MQIAQKSLKRGIWRIIAEVGGDISQRLKRGENMVNQEKTAFVKNWGRISRYVKMYKWGSFKKN